MAYLTSGNGGGYVLYNEDVTIGSSFTGDIKIYTTNPLTHSFKIDAPIGGIGWDQGTSSLVISLEGGRGTIYLYQPFLLDSNNEFKTSPRYGWADITIDLMPHYGIDEQYSYDLTDPNNQDAYLLVGTPNNDDLEDKIEYQTGYEPWNAPFSIAALARDGDDIAEGTPFNDVIFGGDGSDMLDAGSGNDVIYGGSKTDALIVDTGAATLLSGGGGSDLLGVNLGSSNRLDVQGAFNQYDDGTGNIIVDDAWAFEDVVGVQTHLTSIYDHNGDNDILLIEGDNTNAVMFDPNANPLALDKVYRVEIIDGDLEFAVGFSQYAQDNLVALVSRNIEWTWYKAQGYIDTLDPPDPDDYYQYDFGMSAAEFARFDFYDPTTYPGFDQLNAEAQVWLAEHLDPYSYSSFSEYSNFVNQLAFQFYAHYEWSNDNSTGQDMVVRNQADLDSANANTAFMLGDYSTYPVLNFARALDWNIYDATSAQFDLSVAETGFEILDFDQARDNVEYIGTWTQALVEATQSVAYASTEEDPIGQYFLSQAVTGNTFGNFGNAINNTLAFAETNNYLDKFKISNTGIALDQEAAFLLANENVTFSTDIGTTAYADINSASIASTGAIAAGKGGDDVLFSLYSGTATSTLAGAGGNDWFEIQGGMVNAVGGTGDDVFVVRDNGLNVTASIFGGSGNDTLYIQSFWDSVEYSYDVVNDEGSITLGTGRTVTFTQVANIVFLDQEFIPENSPKPSAEQIILGGGVDQYFDTEFDVAQEIYSGGGWDFIDAGSGDDIIHLEGSTFDSDGNIYQMAFIDGGDGDDELIVESTFVGDAKIYGLETITVNQAYDGMDLGDNGNLGDYFIYTSGGGMLWLDDYSPEIINFYDGSELTHTINWTTGYHGTAGNDTVSLALDKTEAYGYQGDDIITVSSALNTYIDGGAGNDILTGGHGDDEIFGDTGNDLLIQTRGNDVLKGGQDSDTYRLYAPEGTLGIDIGRATIIDAGGDNDILDLSAFGYDGSSEGFWNVSDGILPAVFIKDGDLNFVEFQKSADSTTTLTRDVFRDDVDDMTSYIDNGFTIQAFANGGTVETVDFGSGGVFKLSSSGVAATSDNHYLVANSDFYTSVLSGAAGNDVLIGAESSSHTVLSLLDGGAGNDSLYAIGDENVLVGGEGADVFRIMADDGSDTLIFGDTVDTSISSINLSTDLSSISNANSSRSDVVEFGWSINEAQIEKTAKGYKVSRVEDGEVVQTVDIMDVEHLKFWNDSSNTWDFDQSLLQGEVVDLTTLDYGAGKVRFKFGHGTESLSDDSGIQSKDAIQVWKETSADVWEFHDVYDRNGVEKFDFYGSNDVHVFNIKDQSWLSSSTSNVANQDGTGYDDIIYGDERSNVIDGKGGNDYIFGGDGDDVLVGGDGSDTLLGGDGRDEIFGDLGEGQSLVLTDQDDLIIGGAGLDNIDSGAGYNLVVSGKIDPTANDVVNQAIESYDGYEMFDDDDWV